MTDESPKTVFYDRTRDRYLITLSNGDYLNWDHPDWVSVMWIVAGRTDTDWDVMPHPYVCFYHKEDAETAIWAIRKHSQFIRTLASRYVKVRGAQNAA